MSIPSEDTPGKPVSDEVDLIMPEDNAGPTGAGKSDEVQINVDADKVVTPKQVRNYEFTAPIVSNISDEELEKFDGVIVPMLGDNLTGTDGHLEANSLGRLDVHENSISWYQTLSEGFASHPKHGIFEDALADPNAAWRNSLSYNGNPINIGRPKYTNTGRGGTMSSERLTLSVRSRLGLGSPVQVPMMASGFYATVKPLGEDEIIELWRDVIATTVRLGRVTHGLLFSNNQVFASKAVYDAWRKNLVNTTVKDMPLDNLADHLSINDMPLIAHSVATSLYPNGFPLVRAVFEDATMVPKGEIKQLIDVRKSLVMNGNAFKDAQLAHMTARIEQPMTLKSVKEYRDQFSFSNSVIIEIDESIKLHLHTPSLREYFDSGEKWINEIQAAVHEALGETATEDRRVAHISRLAQASRLRQYSHYVKAIEENGELYSTRENVDQVLSALSASNTISRKFNKAVSDYINTTQIALIATTSVNEFEDTMSGDKWPRLIPIDAISVFFQLVGQKLRGIVSRNLEDTSD